MTITYTTTNSLGELTWESFHVSPNPVKDQLSVSADFNTSEKQYKITDMSGRTVLSGDLKQNMIDVSSLKNTCYLIQIEGKTTRFIKE